MTLRTNLPDIAAAVVMLDFDGTLVEFAPTPDGVIVPGHVPPLLATLHARSRGATLITGRAVDDILGFLPEFAGDIYGSHGSEHRVNGARGTALDIAGGVVAALWSGADDIAALAPDALVAERKPAGVVIHYRRAPVLGDQVMAAARALAARHDGFEVHPSKMAAEVRPRGHGKGEAAAQVIAANPGCVPLFAGDDATDEDAMQVVNAAGGVSIKVGDGDTCATLRVADVSAMHALLAKWTKDA